MQAIKISFLVLISSQVVFAGTPPSLSDLTSLNNSYSTSYLDYLQTERSTNNELLSLNPQLQSLQSQDQAAKAAYMNQYTPFAALQQKIQSAPGDIQALQGQIASLQANAKTLATAAVQNGYFSDASQVSSANAKNKITDANNNAQKFQDGIDQLNSQIMQIKKSPDYLSLAQSRLDAQNYLNKLQSNLSDATNQRANLKTSIANTQSQLAELSTQVSALQNRRVELNNSIIPALQLTASQLQSQMQELDNHLQDAENRLQAASIPVQQMYDRLNLLTGQQNSIQNQLNALVNENNQIQAQLQQMPALAQDLQNLIQREIPNVQQDLAARNQQVAQAQQNVAVGQAAVHQVGEQLQQLQGELANLNQQKAAAGQDVARLQSELQSINQQLAQAGAMQAKLNQIDNGTLPKAQNNLSSLESRISQLQQSQAPAENQVAAAQAAVSAQESNVQSAVQTQTSALQRILELNRQSAQLQQELNSLGQVGSQIQDLENQKAQQQQQLASAQSIIQITISGRDSAAGELNSLLAANAGKPDTPAIASLRQRIAFAETTIPQMQAGISQINNGLSRIESQIQALQNTLANADSLRNQLSQIQNSDVPAASARQQAANQALIEQRDRLAQLKQALSSAQTALEQTSGVLRQIQAQRDQAQGVVNSLQSQRNDLTQRLAGLANLQSRQSQLQNSLIPQALGQANAFDGAIQSKSQAVAQVQQVYQQKHSELTQAQNQAAQIENDIRSVQTKLNAMNQRAQDLSSALAQARPLQDRQNQLASQMIPQTNASLNLTLSQLNSLTPKYQEASRRLAEIERERDEVRDRLAAAKNSYDNNNANLADANMELVNLNTNMGLRQADIANGENQLADLQNQLSDTLNSISQLQQAVGPAQSQAAGSSAAFEEFVQAHIGPIQNQVNQANSGKASWEKAAQDLTDLVQGLEQDAGAIATANSQISDIQTGLPNWQAQVATATPTIAKLKNAWDQVDQSLSQIEDHIAADKKVLGDKLQALEALQAQQDQLIQNLSASGLGSVLIGQQKIEKSLGSSRSWQSSIISNHDLLASNSCIASTVASKTGSSLDVAAPALGSSTGDFTTETVVVTLRKTANFVRGILVIDQDPATKISLVPISNLKNSQVFGLIVRPEDRQKLVAQLKNGKAASLKLIDGSGHLNQTLSFSLSGSTKAIQSIESQCRL